MQLQGADAAAVLAAARTAGDKWNHGSPGIGTVGHIGMELLKARAGITPVHVPYPGYPQVVTAMIAGDIQLSMLPPGRWKAVHRKPWRSASRTTRPRWARSSTTRRSSLNKSES